MVILLACLALLALIVILAVGLELHCHLTARRARELFTTGGSE